MLVGGVFLRGGCALIGVIVGGFIEKALESLGEREEKKIAIKMVMLSPSTSSSHLQSFSRSRDYQYLFWPVW